MESFQQELRTFVVNNFLFGKDETLNDNDSFMEKGIIDSTGILELLSFIEEKYGIKVEDHEVVPENLDSINLLVDFVRKKLPEVRAS
jgi:acyl carrier protein